MPAPRPPSEVVEPVLGFLRGLAREQFWGAITLKYEGGRVVHVRREENLKPKELSRESRWKYASGIAR